jgi:hypothetical protein
MKRLSPLPVGLPFDHHVVGWAGEAVDGVGRVLGTVEEGLKLRAHEMVFVRVGVERSRHE